MKSTQIRARGACTITEEALRPTSPKTGNSTVSTCLNFAIN